MNQKRRELSKQLVRKRDRRRENIRPALNFKSTLGRTQGVGAALVDRKGCPKSNRAAAEYDRPIIWTIEEGADQ